MIVTPELLTGLDKFNSAFEFSLMIPFYFGLRTLYRVKDSRALNALEQWPYMLHCVYTVGFFGLLDRWWSAAALAGWACMFVVKITMIKHYRKPQFMSEVLPENVYELPQVRGHGMGMRESPRQAVGGIRRLYMRRRRNEL